MTVRLPQAEAKITAPVKLLERLFERADGWRSFDDIAGINGARDAGLASFMRELLRKGVLVDAAGWMAHAARAGQLPRPWGRTAQRNRWERLRHLAPARLRGCRTVRPAALSLAGALAERRSLCTFGERPLQLRVIAALLWAMYGVLPPRAKQRLPVRRTTPSAGAFYALGFHLLLLRPVESLPAGVFRIAYSEDGRIGFRRCSRFPDGLPRAFLDPEMLDYAAGVVVVSADASAPALKYGARSFQYLLLEAGHAIQNAALASTELGLAGTAVGGYDDERMAGFCGVRGRPILATFVFGARPTKAQVRAWERRLPVEFAWVDDLPRFPLHIARATVGGRAGWACDRSASAAHAKAVAEAVERHAFCTPPSRAIRARMNELPGAVDPGRIVRYSEEQYLERRFPFRRFDPGRACTWVPAVERGSGKRSYVLAECVYALQALDRSARRLPFTEASSSGCASAPDLESAILRGTLELLERDAFMRSWAAQRGGTGIRLDSLPRELLRRARALQDEGIAVSLQVLESVAASVFFCMLQHTRAAFTCVGAAAALDPMQSLAAAFSEAEVMAWVRMGEATVRRLAPGEVRTPADHGDLYAMPAYHRKADALLRIGGRESFRRVAKPRLESADKLYEKLRSKGMALHWIDLSVSGASLSQGRRPLKTVRVIAPGLVPMAFGAGRLPLGMIGRWERGSLFPHPFT